MHYRLKSLSLASATLLLSLTSPLLPLTLNFEPLVAQAQTTQDRKAEVARLNEEGLQKLDRGQVREALEKFQKALVIIAAIASLWQVSDGGTQVLMNAFYAALNKSMTKAEALRQAQIALITKDLSAVGGSRGEDAWIELVSTRTGRL